MSKSLNALDNKVSTIFNLSLASTIILLCFFFFFFVTLNNFLTTPIVTVNIKANEAPATPTGIPTTVVLEAMLKVPNDADNVIKTSSA